MSEKVSRRAVITTAAGVTTLGFGVALAVRYALIEPASLGETCQMEPALWWCQIRLGFVLAFMADGFGAGCLILAGVAYFLGDDRRGRMVTYTALLAGAMALVQYNAHLAAPGFLLAVLRTARLGR